MTLMLDSQYILDEFEERLCFDNPWFMYGLLNWNKMLIDSDLL